MVPRRVHRVIGHPYPGLRSFGRDEAAIFFGREDQVDQLLDKLQETHFVAVLGVSGSGKSSLVRAGLLPALDSGFMAGAGARWAVAELRPGDRPFSRLAAALVMETEWGQRLGAAGQPTGAMGRRDRAGVAADLEGDLRRGDLALNWRLGVQPLAEGTRLLLLVDQFEELFRYHRTADADAGAFVALLLGAASHADVYLVITMRSEFLGDCARFPGLSEAINAGLFLTPRLTPEQIADAVELPARLFDGEVEPALLRRLLEQVRGESDQLPLLQHALMRLWDLDGGDRRLTAADLDALGGLRVALEAHVEEAFAELSGEQQRIAEVLFRALAERGPEERDTRRPVPLHEVADLAAVEPTAVAAVVEVFRRAGRSFLMPPPGVALDQDRMLDITHEALIRQWSRLRDWTADEAERAEHYRRLVGAATRWRQGTGALWVDPDLELGLQWREQTRPTARWATRYGGDFADAMAFLDAGREQRARRRAEAQAGRRRALRRARLTALAAIIGLAVVAGAAGWAWIERQNALASELRRTRDLFDSGLTHAALLARTEDYAGAGRLLAKTRELDREVPASRRLGRDLALRLTQILGGESDRVYDGAGAPLSQALISADGVWVAACGERGTLVLFDAASGRLVHRLRGHDPAVQIRDCVLDPAGRWLASAGNDGRIIVWSLPAAGRAPELLRHWAAGGAVMALAVDPSGRLLASGGEGGTISLWDPETGTRLRTLRGHRARISEVTGLDFSPDGGRLASASYDGTARLWDPADGAEVARLEGHGTAVKGVAFSTGGHGLASAGDDQRVILWDTGDLDEVQVFTGHRNAIYGVAVAERSGEPNAPPLLIAGGFDRTIRVWDMDSAVTLRLLQGHVAAVNGIDVRGTALYSASSDGTVRRWNLSLPHQRLLDLRAEPASAAISPDGRRVAVGFADGALRLYALPGLELLAEQPGAHGKDVQRLAFSTDGSLLASAGFDHDAALWRVSSEGRLAPLHTLTGHKEPVAAVAFSPDGRLVATAGYDARIGLFDVASGEGELVESTDGDGDRQILSVAFGPTGRVLYAADRDGRQVHVWDLRRDPPLLDRMLPASRDLLMWAEPDAGGSRLAVTGRDYVVSVLDAEDGATLHSLAGHENAVFKARFLATGEQLATTGVDATVRLWDLPTETELSTLRLPTNQGLPVPLWDFDLRCTPAGCWLAVPLTRGKLAVYGLGEPALPHHGEASPAPAPSRTARTRAGQ
jgi:WD40 repeat protein